MTSQYVTGVVLVIVGGGDGGVVLVVCMYVCVRACACCLAPGHANASGG
jgi:hypothetical protein